MRIKSSKKIKEELPSFLKALGPTSETVALPRKRSFHDQYVGMLFFGETEQKHPSPHKPNLKETHQVQHKVPVTEYVLQDIFLTPEELALKKKKKIFPTKTFRLKKRRKPCQRYIDPYPQSCPGGLKIFVPEVCAPVVDFGETSSVIVGEACREIPVLRSKRSHSGTLIGEMEVVLMSDLWEEKRLFLSPEERMAHTHFFKKFGTVTVIGPKIPASITITELPTKRKKLSDLNFFNELKAEELGGSELEHKKPKLPQKVEATGKEEEEQEEEVEDDDDDDDDDDVVDVTSDFFDIYPSTRPPRNTFASTASSYLGKKWELSFRALKEGMERGGIQFDDDPDTGGGLAPNS